MSDQDRGAEIRDSLIPDPETRRWFIEQLREARADAQRDAEGCDSIIVVLERMGMFLTKRMGTLSYYKARLVKLAEESPVTVKDRSDHLGCLTPFSRLYDYVERGRNKAYHEGAYARHLTTHAIAMTVALEHSLMQHSTTVGDLMVPNPVCAFLWQPISFVRQTMLVNSFSYLPIRRQGDGQTKPWQFITASSVAEYVRSANSWKDGRARLATSVENALASDKPIRLVPARTYSVDASIQSVMKRLQPGTDEPVLITRADFDLVGILSPFDLL